MFFEDWATGRENLRGLIYKIADEFAIDQKIPLRIKPSIIDEVLASTKETLGFYGIELQNINHYKEISHVAFWIAKLKPIKIEPPRSLGRYIKQVIQPTKEMIYGDNAEFEAEVADAEDKYHHVISFPINEYVALLICLELIEVCWLKEIDSVHDREVKKVFQDRMGFLKDRFGEETVLELAWSLRFHNFSARGFTSMIEAVFRLRMMPVAPDDE